MCVFCEKTNTLELEIRSTYSDDNICESISCENCFGCSDNRLSMIINKDNLNNSYINLEYFKNKKGEINHPYSEQLHINYCPFCGEKISEDTLDVMESTKYIGKLK